MSPFVEFAYEFPYRTLDGRTFFPGLDVTLIGPRGEEDLIALLDTGASYCLFNGVRAEPIGLDLTAGRKQLLNGLTGSLVTWVHPVRLEVFGSSFRCEVAFSEQPISREFLGRHTFFNQVRLGFREGLSIGYFHPTR